jgi:hypothetical protein
MKNRDHDVMSKDIEKTLRKEIVEKETIKEAEFILSMSSKVIVPVDFKAFGVDELEVYELPELSEKHREFAFRTAIESRSISEWSRIFHVSPQSICDWKKNPKIHAYTNIIRRKRLTLLAEKNIILEDKARSKLLSLLDIDINDDNIDSIRKAILDALNVSKGILPISGVSQNLNVHQSTEQKTGVVQSVEINKPASTSTMREKINEIELLEEIIGKGKESE